MNSNSEISLDAFFPSVLGIASTVSPQFAEHFILQSVIEAAQRTKSVKHTDFIDAQAGVSEYAIPLRSGYRLIQLDQVAVNGVCYEPTRERPCPKPAQVQATDNRKCKPAQLGCSDGGCWTNDFQNGNGSCGATKGTYYVDSGQIIILDPPPEMDIDNGIEVTISVAPSRFTCKVPIEFLERWGEDIAYGALSKIHLQMNTKHYSPQQAAYFQKMWETALKRMRGQQFINYVPGDEKINTTVRLI